MIVSKLLGRWVRFNERCAKEYLTNTVGEIVSMYQNEGKHLYYDILGSDGKINAGAQSYEFNVLPEDFAPGQSSDNALAEGETPLLGAPMDCSPDR